MSNTTLIIVIPDVIVNTTAINSINILTCSVIIAILLPSASTIAILAIIRNLLRELHWE